MKSLHMYKYPLLKRTQAPLFLTNTLSTPIWNLVRLVKQQPTAHALPVWIGTGQAKHAAQVAQSRDTT